MDNQITYAYLETTNHCNFNCSFCNRDEVVDKLSHMPIPKFKTLLEKIKDEPISEVKLMGMGEPFLHPKFDEICQLFRETFPKAKIITSTNCSYKIIPQLIKSLKYIDVLYLSIDGYRKTYEEHRPPARWSKLISFLNKFKSMDRHDCKVVINYVVTPSNVGSIQPVYDEILIPYKLEELRLNFAQNWTENEIMVGGYTKSQIEYLKNTWSDNIMGKSKWDYNDCFWPDNGLYMTVNGDLKMCCLNTGTDSFGNIFDNTIDEIKQTKRYQEIKDGCKTNNPTEHCVNCSYKELVPLLLKTKND